MTQDGKLMKKFKVSRIDGTDKPGERHEKCEYYVLDMIHDPYSRPALFAYAAACEKTHPILASEIRKRLDELSLVTTHTLNTRYKDGKF